MPELEAFVPPAQVFDKHRYSAFASPGLGEFLHQRKIDTLVISGGETDLCALATVMQAVDLGYSVVLVTDALCSFIDQTMTRCCPSITSASPSGSRRRPSRKPWCAGTKPSGALPAARRPGN